jgi:hypothetical protein
MAEVVGVLRSSRREPGAYSGRRPSGLGTCALRLPGRSGPAGTGKKASRTPTRPTGRGGGPIAARTTGPSRMAARRSRGSSGGNGEVPLEGGDPGLWDSRRQVESFSILGQTASMAGLTASDRLMARFHEAVAPFPVGSGRGSDVDECGRRRIPARPADAAGQREDDPFQAGTVRGRRPPPFPKSRGDFPQPSVRMILVQGSRAIPHSGQN